MLILAPLLASLLWAWVAPCASTDLQSIRCPGGAHLREAAPPADANRPEFPSRKLTLEGWVWLGRGGDGPPRPAGLMMYSLDAADGGNDTLAFSAVAAEGGLEIVMHGIEASLKGPDAISEHRWTHVAVVWDTEKGQVKGFINSLPQGESLFEQNLFIPPGGTIRVATGARASDGRFKSFVPLGDRNSVVELRLWSATFTEKELRQSLMLSPDPL